MAKNNKIDKVEVASNTSNEVPNTSNEAPNTSNEAPNTSKEVPNTSKEVPNSSNEASNTSKEGVYIVIHPFADKDNFSKMWETGEDVSHFDRKRLESCIERGLVKKQG